MLNSINVEIFKDMSRVVSGEGIVRVFRWREIVGIRMESKVVLGGFRS